MFILGLVVGPAIGVLAGVYFGRTRGDMLRGGGALALFLLFVIFAPFLDLELKIGLVVGMLAGLLLAATPFSLESSIEEAQ